MPKRDGQTKAGARRETGAARGAGATRGAPAAAVVRTSPFHERTAALNRVQLWSHWANYLAADRYQLSDKAEYFAVRNAAGIFDSSPLYKYRSAGPTRRPSSPGCSRATSGRARPAAPSTRAGSTTAASSSRTASSCTCGRASTC